MPNAMECLLGSRYSFLRNLFYEFCGDSAHYCIGSHIFGYDRTGGYNGIFADCHPAQYRNIRANPYISADMYRRRYVVATVGRTQVVVV